MLVAKTFYMLWVAIKIPQHMVTIAQLAERRIVVPNVVGSSPTGHPKRLLIWTRISKIDS